MLYLDIKYFNELIYLFFDIFFISSIFILLCYGLFLKSVIKSLYLNKFIIDLSQPILFCGIFFIYFYIYNNLNSNLLLGLDFSNLVFNLKLILLIFLIFFLFLGRNSFYFDKIFN